MQCVAPAAPIDVTLAGFYALVDERGDDFPIGLASEVAAPCLFVELFSRLGRDVKRLKRGSQDPLHALTRVLSGFDLTP